jgi:Ser/Thr protein kinase RdoA (MazF antagonist)
MTIVPDTEITSIEAVLSSSPEWSGCHITARSLSGGQAHKNYLVQAGQRCCVVKLWNNYWETVGVLPAAHVVLENTKIAADIGVGAPVITVSAEPPALALDFVAGGHPRLNADEDSIARLVPALHRLHHSGRRFLNDINPFKLAKQRMAAAEKQGIDLPPGAAAVQELMDRVEATLALNPAQFVPCHLDIWDANIIKQTSSLTYNIIDWDLAGNSDPCYEIGFIAAQNGFDDEKAHALFQAYFGTNDPAKIARARLFMAVAHWSNSGLWITAMGNAEPNDDADYAGELRTSWEGLIKEITAPGFPELIKTAATPAALV